MGNLALFIPEAVVLGSALIIFAMMAFGAGWRTIRITSIVLTLGAMVAQFIHLRTEGQPFFPDIYQVDAFSQVLKIGILVGLLLTLLAAEKPGSVYEPVRREVPLFLLFSTLGMMMLVSATEMLTLYVALELSAYGLYILAALNRNRGKGSEGAAKYVLFGAASSAVTLYGISLIFGITGTTSLSAIANNPISPMLVVGVLLALSGVLFKLAVFPFHAWAPDAYEGGPHESVTFIGTASKVAAVGVLARLLFLVGNDSPNLITVLLVLCVLSMTIGNLAAMVQGDIKRLLAYSTVAHAGYILIGLVCMSSLGLTASIFYAMVYVPIVFCLFLVVCVLGRDGSNPTRASLAGLYRRSPLLGIVLLCGLFGLAGIPPTSGFAGKWFLFTAAIDQDLFWLVIVGVINATISLYYYLQLVRAAYLEPSDEAPIELSPMMTITAWLAIARVRGTGIFPGPLLDLCETAARVIAG